MSDDEVIDLTAGGEGEESAAEAAEAAETPVKVAGRKRNLDDAEDPQESKEADDPEIIRVTAPVRKKRRVDASLAAKRLQKVIPLPCS